MNQTLESSAAKALKGVDFVMKDGIAYHNHLKLLRGQYRSESLA